MTDTIVCPNCKTVIPVTQALTAELQAKYQKDHEEVEKKFAAERERLIELSKKRIEETRLQAGQEALKEAQTKAAQEFELKLKNQENEAAEARKRASELQNQILELTRSLRETQSKQEALSLEYEKKLSQQLTVEKEKAKELAEESLKLQMLEKDKMLNDQKALIEDMKRKMQQGSQQTQGEVLELEVERILREAFPHDEISEVPKGVVGADLTQTVRNTIGKPCGIIVWELKRTKTWGGDWTQKLKDDKRNLKADIAILISQVLPSGLKRFGEFEGVWVGDYEAVLGLATALRSQLLAVSTLRSQQEGKADKMELLYEYLTGNEFKLRVEGIVEAFEGMREDLERERKQFQVKWARQEKQIQKVLSQTLGMHGDLAGIVGKSLPEISGLDVPQSEPEIKKLEDSLF